MFPKPLFLLYFPLLLSFSNYSFGFACQSFVEAEALRERASNLKFPNQLERQEIGKSAALLVYGTPLSVLQTIPGLRPLKSSVFHSMREFLMSLGKVPNDFGMPSARLASMPGFGPGGRKLDIDLMLEKPYGGSDSPVLEVGIRFSLESGAETLKRFNEEMTGSYAAHETVPLGVQRVIDRNGLSELGMTLVNFFSSRGGFKASEDLGEVIQKILIARELSPDANIKDPYIQKVKPGSGLQYRDGGVLVETFDLWFVFPKSQDSNFMAKFFDGIIASGQVFIEGKGWE